MDQKNEINCQDTIYYRRSYAKSKLVLEKKEGRCLSKTSLLANRIDDTIRQIMQSRVKTKDFKYDILSKMAENELSIIFEKLELNKANNREQEREKKLKKRIAISNWIEKYIEKNYSSTVRLDYNQFIALVNSNSLKKSTNQALRILDTIQDLNKYEIEHPQLNLETGKIEVGLSKVNALPRITLWLSDKFKDKGYSLKSFAELEIKNKRQYIEGIEFKFDTSYLYYVIGIGNDYTVSYRSKRDQLKWTVSYKLDIFINSIAIYRSNKKLMKFLIPDLKAILGAREDLEYKYFKRDYLIKPLKDINRVMEKHVGFTEEKEGRRVTHIIFSIEDVEFDEFVSFKYDYISSQMYFFSKIEIKNLTKFKNFIKNKTFDEDEKIGNKTIEQWFEEAEKAYICEKEILSAQDDKEDMFIKNNLIYDIKKHTILNDTVYLENGEKHHKYSLVSWKNSKISNPIIALEYLISLENEDIKNSMHLIDFIPFSYALPSRKWVKIDSINKFEKYKTEMYRDIILKRKEMFSMKDDLKIIFDSYVEKEMFTDINRKFLKEIKIAYGIKGIK